jgi:hypothetical protein
MRIPAFLGIFVNYDHSYYPAWLECYMTSIARLGWFAFQYYCHDIYRALAWADYFLRIQFISEYFVDNAS